jgi:hypothetical protein
MVTMFYKSLRNPKFMGGKLKPTGEILLLSFRISIGSFSSLYLILCLKKGKLIPLYPKNQIFYFLVRISFVLSFFESDKTGIFNMDVKLSFNGCDASPIENFTDVKFILYSTLPVFLGSCGT